MLRLGSKKPRNLIITVYNEGNLCSRTCSSSMAIAHRMQLLDLLAIRGALFAASLPVKSAYLNGLIPSAQRATVLSTDNLLGSASAVGIQPALAKTADVWSYGTSYVVGAAVELLAVPFLLLARRGKAKSDPFTSKDAPPSA